VYDPEAQRPAAARAWPALVLAAVTVVGSAVRLAVAGQSVFADELSTYWIVSNNGLGGVVSTVHGNAEITPPLYFVAAWVTTQFDLTPQLLRAPSLVAGIAAIPLTYVLGLRTLGRAPALVAATLTALSPFMIYYSAEARGYALAITLVLLSTIALVAASEGGSSRWWIVYGVCTWAAVLSHYTAVFALAAQLLWVFWAHREARRPALMANGAAVLAFLPWSTGFINDLRSPTTDILDALSPFDPDAMRVALGHWSIGYPYSSLYAPKFALRHMPGIPALVLLATGLALALVGVAAQAAREAPGSWRRLDRRVVLVFALAVATPVGAALVSAVGTNLFGTRNLAVSWPGFALSLSALLVAAGRRLRVAATVLVVACFAIGAVKMLQSDYERPDYQGMARFLDEDALPGDVVVDAASVVTPGPFTGLDVSAEKPHRVFRVGVPQQRDHPFTVADPISPLREVVRRAARAAAGRRIYVASDSRFRAPLTEQIVDGLPAAYRQIEERTYSGGVVRVYEDPASPRG
jgi:hypothetical protein